MIGLGLGLTLASSVAWAGLDAVRKYLAGRLGAITLVAWLVTGQTLVYLGWWAASDVDHDAIDLGAYAGWGLLDVGLNFAANVLFVRSVALSPLSLTIPFLSFTPVFSTAIAAPLLGQFPNPMQWVGVGIVVLGALVLGLPPRSASSGGRRLQLGWVVRERGVPLMLAVAALWSGTAVIDVAAMEYAPAPVHAVVQTGGMAILAFGYLAVRGALGELRAGARNRGGLLAAILLAAVAFGLQLVAVGYVLVGLLETIKRVIGLAMGVVVGRLAFDEPITRAKLLGTAVMAGGTVAVLLG